MMWPGISSARKCFLCLLVLCICVVLIPSYFLLLETHYNTYPTNAKTVQTSNKNTSVETRTEGRFIIVFSYHDQLTAATKNLLQLEVLASHVRRQVVLPFVANSRFFGTKLDNQTATLASYYNITQFNLLLRSYGWGTLVSWETFQTTCRQTLDVLLDFRYGESSHSKTKNISEKTGLEFFPCDVQNNTFQGFKIEKTICVGARSLRSLEQFENELVKNLPCVGIKEWRGDGKPNRISLPSLSINGSIFRDQPFRFFNEKLVQIAQDFITKKLQPGFISVHIRSEMITPDGKDLTLLKKCLSELTANVLQTIATDPSRPLHNLKIFLASDISAHGSYSRRILAARTHGVEFIFKEYLSILNATTFQPRSYELTDRGSAAIVEMIILRYGEKLFLCGGGSFQRWIKYQYITWNANARGSSSVYVSCTRPIANG